MSAQVQISQLPPAGTITGSELVPVVQNGQTVQTTTGAIAASPSQTQTFLTKNQELTLPNSRYLSTGTGLGFTDGGAESFYRISLNGASGSLESAAGGIIVKNSASTVVARSLATTGAGLSVVNEDGTGGNPTFQLTGIAAAVADMTGTGLLTIVGGTAIAGRQILGTTNQIAVTAGNGSGNPTIGLADNAVLPGTSAMTLPKGTTTQQPAGEAGQFRFNTDTATFDGFNGSDWLSFALGAGVDTFSAGGTGFTPSSPTTGAIVLSGVLNASHGGTGANSLTGYVKGNGTSAMTASSTIPTTDLSGTLTNAQLQYSSLTVNGTTIALGGSDTITAVSPNALTIGTGLSGGSYNGSAAVTVAIANTGVTANSYGGASKTLTATVNAQGQLTALAETPIAIANTQVSGLGTMSTQNANSVAITGGSVDGATIGGSTPGAGTFTALATTTGTISTAPTNSTDLVNKQYVDEQVAAGLDIHTAVKYEVPDTTGNLTATYNNGASGVGATLTNAGTLGAFTPDGVVASAGDRVLIYNQTNAVQNGVYTVTTVGSGSIPWVLTRATDANSYGANNPAKLGQGSYFFVTSGDTGAGESYVCNTVGTITFGTTAITFSQFSSSVPYHPGTGLNLSPATTFNISDTGVTAASYGTASSVPTLAVNAQGQITSASNTTIAINANQITSGAVTNTQLANSSVTINGSSVALGGSTTITAASPNALTAGTGLTGGSYDGSAVKTFALDVSGVSAATYGSASQVPVFAVDTYGRVTSVTNTSIAIAAGAVSGLAPSATTDTTNASNIASGTLGTGRLAGSYTGITGVGTLTAGTWNANAIGVGYGGTGLTATPTNGQLAIGNGTGYSLATLTPGTNVSILNTAGNITISATPAAGGTVTSVDASGGTTGLSFSGGPVTVSGTLTMAGTLVPANGGTGATTLTGYVYGNGTSTMTASTTIPNTAITGLGTMSTQNASGVAITGGTINGATVGATTATTVRGTTITATTQFSGSGAGLTSIPNSATTATNTNTASAIVARDASGNFSAGTITATLSGSATQVSNSLTLATSGTGLSGSATFNGSSAQTFTVTSNATNVNTASTIVARDASGNFSAGTITATLSGNASTATTATNQSGGTVNATTGAFSSTVSFGGGSGVASTGDIVARRSAGATGVYYFVTQGGSVYLYYDGTNFNFNGGSTLNQAGAFVATGNVTAYSDERLKTDWGSVAPSFVQRMATEVKYGTYTRTDSGERHGGVSAQDWQKLLPETVVENKGYLTIAYGNAALVACIELAKEVQALKAEIDTLKQGK